MVLEILTLIQNRSLVFKAFSFQGTLLGGNYVVKRMFFDTCLNILNPFAFFFIRGCRYPRVNTKMKININVKNNFFWDNFNSYCNDNLRTCKICVFLEQLFHENLFYILSRRCWHRSGSQNKIFFRQCLEWIGPVMI